MTECGSAWISDPSRLCEADPIPGLTVCLAHVDRRSRQNFLAKVNAEPALLKDLLRNLEVHWTLLGDLRDIMTSFTPIDFQGSEFLDSCVLSKSFAGKVDFSYCRFRGRVWFLDFPQEAYFLHTRFEDEAVSGNFYDAARFDHATFSSSVTFGDFHADAWFSAAHFESGVQLSPRNGVRVRFHNATPSTVVVNQ